MTSTIHSMTGFASKNFAIALSPEAQAQITLSIKSLNSRFFETTFKLPYALSNLETELMQRSKAKLKRGHVFFTINMTNPNIFKAGVEPSLPVVHSYVAAAEKIKQKFGIDGELTISDIVDLPNVFSIEEVSIDETLRSTILEETELVLDALVAVRAEEGARIVKDIQYRANKLADAITLVEQNSKAVIEARREKIKQELAALGVNLDTTAEAQRALLFTEITKMDVTEEIVRFKSHLQAIKNLLASDELEKGKRLDFTIQELNRETNTIASKSADATIAALAINIKVDLEKMREQTQNIV